MTLSDLYPAGTRLAEVHPDFRGMDLAQWSREKAFEQGEAWRKTVNLDDVPLTKQRIWTARDDYGTKGNTPSVRRANAVK